MLQCRPRVRAVFARGEAWVNAHAVRACDGIHVGAAWIREQYVASLAHGVAIRLVVAVVTHRKGVAKGRLAVHTHVDEAGRRGSAAPRARAHVAHAYNSGGCACGLHDALCASVGDCGGVVYGGVDGEGFRGVGGWLGGGRIGGIDNVNGVVDRGDDGGVSGGGGGGCVTVGVGGDDGIISGW